MALGTIASAVAASAASAGTSFGLSKLFGGGSSSGGGGGGGAGSPSASMAAFKPTGIDAGGLVSKFNPSSGRISIKSDPDRQGFVRGLALTFPEQAAELSRLRGLVAPGMSGLRAARLGEVDTARSRAIGNLRENLQRRRVLGSSFGQDALVRGELEFGRERDRIAAETFLQELDLTQQFITKEFETRRMEFTTFLDEMNLQADLATQLASGATSQLGANARLKAELAFREAEGAGSFFGKSVIGPVSSAVGKGVSALGEGFSNWMATGNAGVPAFNTTTTFG